jgi:glycosyltransferase involved in cell wall biosynthesis
MRLAYLNSELASVSHSFVAGELHALRSLGVEVHPFSVRRPPPERLVGEASRRLDRETCTLLDPGASWPDALDALRGRSLPNLLRAVWTGQRQAPGGLPSRGRHLAYVAEATRLTHELRRRGLRHVHVHMANNAAMIALLAAQLDPQLSWSLTIHGSAEFFHVDTWRLAQKAEAARFVRCISDLGRAQVMAWTAPETWARVHVVRCGVDLGQLRPGPAPTEGPLRILSVGRLHPIKGHRVLLEACRRLSDRDVAWSLVVVGDGPERGALERLAGDPALGDRVRFLGALPHEQVTTHYAAADLLCVSSFMEGIPIVAMEALAMERPVVATRVGGIPELVRDGREGLLVSPGSSTALADALAELAADPSRRREMGLRGRERLTGAYLLEDSARAMRDLFARYGVA